MEHDEAVQSGAAESYVADELSPAERKAFEEHFFLCRKCADNVRFELAFAANVRAASRNLQEEPLKASLKEKSRDGIRLHPTTALSFAANFALAAGFGYILLTGIRKVSRPHLAAVYFAPGPTHGAADVHALPEGETSYGVRFPAPGVVSQSYFYEILNAAGKRESSGSLPAPGSQDGVLYLYVPVDRLRAGVHTLSVRVPGGDIVSWSRFSTSR